MHMCALTSMYARPPCMLTPTPTPTPTLQSRLAKLQSPDPQVLPAPHSGAPFPPQPRATQVDYTGYSTINAQRFGQKFVGKVANPHDMLTWAKAAQRRCACVCLLSVR